MQGWQSDALCRLATGAGFSVREHYSDREEVIFQACRAALLTSIEEIATRGDFLDRCVILSLAAIEPRRRMAESYFNREFERDRPQILGALLDAVSTALKVHPTLSFESLPRMADFASFAAAAMPAIGRKPEDFLNAYFENRADANSLVLEGSKISNYIIDLTNEAIAWQGTAKELLDNISRRATEKELKSKAWPGGPIAMSNALRRITNNLRKAGVEVTFLARKGNKREISIRKSTDETNTAKEW